MTDRIGVLAEDDTDVDAVRVLIQRVLAFEGMPPRRVKGRQGGGCSKLVRKAEKWIRDLGRAGCSRIIIVHDLDDADFNELRRKLESIEIPAEIDRLVCIPVEELEAWFWSDPAVLQEVSNGAYGKEHPEPHCIESPKEGLVDLSVRGKRRPRYTTAENADLARLLDLELCAARCVAFAELRSFVLER